MNYSGEYGKITLNTYAWRSAAMKKIGIVTDSHSSLSPAGAALLGVHVLPMPFDVDGQEECMRGSAELLGTVKY